ncbi:kinase-like domain-containing protein [Mycena albidolilacea]|uniref:Kinase-like domain-containing protein n=1 Tax=Mycena albidolilacea TaxID=1033008 RepID=A0AAD7ETL5_9AGAR|nr:kinase-like domain-containing protein [Mycena albidolilacea]
MVLSPKPQRYSTLPTISEEHDVLSLASNEAHCSQPSPQAEHDIALANFDIIPSSGYPTLCRKRSGNTVYTIKASSHMSHTEKSVLDSVRALCAPFVESVYWSFGEEGQVYLVSEPRSDANLATLVKNSGPVASADVLYYACEVVDALSSLHAANIIHRDLTPFNVFVDHTGHIVLSNFSNAMMISADAPSQSAAMEYQAPEHLLGWAHDFAVDCWSFGTLLHFLLAGTNPVVDGEDPDATRSRILNGNIVLNDLLLTEAKDLIRKCLERNPALRLTIGRIREHNYFANVYGATFSCATDRGLTFAFT